MTLEIAATHRTKHPRLAQEALAGGLPPDLSPMCLAKLVCLKSQVSTIFITASRLLSAHGLAGATQSNCMPCS